MTTHTHTLTHMHFTNTHTHTLTYTNTNTHLIKNVHSPADCTCGTSLILFVCPAPNPKIGYKVLSYMSAKISKVRNNVILGTKCCSVLILHVFWNMRWFTQNPKTVTNKPLLKGTFFTKNSDFHVTVYCSRN